MSDRNKDLVRRFFAAINAHELDPFDEILAKDLVWHGGSSGEIKGIDGFKQLVGAFYTAFPDLQTEMHHLIAEGDVVVAHYTTTGTHKAELSGIPATGKQARWDEQPSYRIVEGKIAEVWYLADTLGLMQQLGAIPSGG